MSPRFSIIIPARNESQNLPRCIEALRAALGQFSYELIVVINRCTDDTEQIARALGCRIVHDDAKNLARLRNVGAAEAAGEVLVTIDADSIAAGRTFHEIEHALSLRNALGGGVLILPERWSLGILLTGICLLPYVLIQGLAGGLFFCTREAFAQIGGFDERCVSAEDIDFARRLKRYAESRGKRFAILYRVPILTSCRKFDRLGDWYFLLRPWKFLTLLRGHNQAAADHIWYDFPREHSEKGTKR